MYVCVPVYMFVYMILFLLNKIEETDFAATNLVNTCICIRFPVSSYRILSLFFAPSFKDCCIFTNVAVTFITHFMDVKILWRNAVIRIPKQMCVAVKKAFL